MVSKAKKGSVLLPLITSINVQPSLNTFQHSVSRISPKSVKLDVRCRTYECWFACYSVFI